MIFQILWKVPVTVCGAIVFAEFAGYFLHKLLHSHRIQYLSRNHMIHHLKLYGPRMAQRPFDSYQSPVEDRSSVAGIGMEWIIPVGILLGGLWGVFGFFGVPWFYGLMFTSTSVFWGFLMFSYIHDGMHIKGFWMANHPLFRRWFLQARRCHDIHHMDLDDRGRMTRNYGICFFFVDRLLRTYADRPRAFNKFGYEAAKVRYPFAFDPIGKPVAKGETEPHSKTTMNEDCPDGA